MRKITPILAAAIIAYASSAKAEPSAEPSIYDTIATPIARCNDGIDNDSDGLTDMFDPECEQHTDNGENERDTKECNDGKDNDYDGFIDGKDKSCTEYNTGFSEDRPFEKLSIIVGNDFLSTVATVPHTNNPEIEGICFLFGASASLTERFSLALKAGFGVMSNIDEKGVNYWRDEDRYSTFGTPAEIRVMDVYPIEIATGLTVAQTDYVDFKIDLGLGTRIQYEERILVQDKHNDIFPENNLPNQTQMERTSATPYISGAIGLTGIKSSPFQIGLSFGGTIGGDLFNEMEYSILFNYEVGFKIR